MPTIQARVAPVLHERFLAHCEERGLKPADVIREAIERIVDHLDDTQMNGAVPALKIANRIAPTDGPKPIGFTFAGEPVYASASPRLKAGKKP